MRYLIQVVNNATLQIVEKNIKKSIWRWLVVYVGISKEDENDYENKIEKISDKIPNLKLFDDEDWKLNLSLKDIEGDLLLIPNFTLFWKNKKWNQIDFSFSSWYNNAKNIYTSLVKSFEKKFNFFECWEFWANMKISSENDWPINVVLDY